MNPLEVVVFAAGAAIVAAVFLSAVSTVVVPRGVPVRLTRAVFVARCGSPYRPPMRRRRR